MDRLYKVSSEGLELDEYASKHANFLSQIKETPTELTQMYTFLNGLPADMQRHIKLQRPKNLEEMVGEAATVAAEFHLP